MVAIQYMGQKITYTKVPRYGGTFTTWYVCLFFWHIAIDNIMWFLWN